MRYSVLKNPSYKIDEDENYNSAVFDLLIFKEKKIC